MLKIGDSVETNSTDLEIKAERIHQVWVDWANHIINTEQLSDDRKKRWKSLMIPYKDLSETEKEKDRKVVRYVMEGTN